MSEIIPGGEYRIDVVGSDDSVLVDSYNNLLKASVVMPNGTVLVDTTTGTLHGIFSGDVVDESGNVVIDMNTKQITGIFTGALAGDVIGDVTGNTTGVHTGSVAGDVVGNLTGNVIGDIQGKGYGDWFGDVVGSVTGNVEGDTTGTHNGKGYGDWFGEVTGNVVGNITGSSTGDHTGNLLAGDSTIIINATNKTAVFESIVASTITGDLIGNITADSVIYGTFNGDFNGTSYGEFFGNTSGEHTGNILGDVTGNIIGNVTGNVTGELLGVKSGDDIATALTRYNDHSSYNQWEWIGGIGSPYDDTGVADGMPKGPLLTTGATRNDAALRSHVFHYDGTPVLFLAPEPSVDGFDANFYGRFVGEFAQHTHNSATPAKPVLSYKDGKTSLYGLNGLLQLGMDHDCDIEMNASAIIKNINLSDESEAVEIIRSFKGESPDTKVAYTNQDMIYALDVEGYNGAGFAQAGTLSFFVDRTDTVKNTGTALPTTFAISLADSNIGVGIDKPSNLEVNNKGVLTVPVVKAAGTTFTARDSMTAEEGMIIFNKNSKKFQGFTGIEWVDLH